MPRAYLISECTDKHADPINAQPVYLLCAPVDWSNEFESWYVEENYAVIDDEGNRYVLRWDSSEGMSAEIVETSSALRSLFHKWLEAWVADLPLRARKALNIADTDRNETYLSSLLDDAELLQRLSARK